MDGSEVTSILCWPTPTSSRELTGFLGLSGYYWRFIRHYGIMAKPLKMLLQKDTN